MKNQLSQLYETDFNLWLEQTVNHLKKGNLQALDLDNLIEEISDMGRNNRREVFGRLKVLLMHLLKWQYQPEKRTNSWINTIDEQREQLELIFRDSPSLKPYLADIFAECYQKAVRGTVNETNLPKETFPVDCPFTQEQVLNWDYFPENSF
ncbi:MULTISPECIES: DUF29 domain-containing protein [Microcystis]|jgi:hypothetical protein|uniref:DUF29 domain-containing protein n=2 Tax=Microcystis TaxID=1125 RepID=A0A0A1VSN4_MICAE|nr:MULTISPECIES: DUF29 domain-containing protein [Microcystis]MBD2118886.1 DUF29 domain-containing protein [Microcystis wesenbergii FACHB-1339]MCZ8037848.1 DUF29 domain-containing protein [Microcystis sp. LE17-20A]MCZ8213717.1 DUF29 domain-containing protein [Microcystis sp. LE19-8.1F]MDT3674780.1 DUF29 domain-containing protein [Microcystis wesenbergii NRERC-220]GAL92832.1 protein of unknown function DUF29 [Microcystis aeruginosa NIES-44]